MRIVLNKIFFLGIFSFLVWYAMDGLIVNFFGGELKEFTINEIESNGIGSSRFVKVNTGHPTGDLIWFELEDKPARIDIIYPLVSQERYLDFLADKEITTNVLVKLEEIKSYCLKDTSCIPNEIEIKGISKSAIRHLSDYELKMIESPNLKLAKDCILIENGSEPRSLYLNIFLFLLGSIFGGAILKSFFKKSKNFKDWIDNITEKKELK